MLRSVPISIILYGAALLTAPAWGQVGSEQARQSAPSVVIEICHPSPVRFNGPAQTSSPSASSIPKRSDGGWALPPIPPDAGKSRTSDANVKVKLKPCS